jgi:hypothetical protein
MNYNLNARIILDRTQLRIPALSRLNALVQEKTYELTIYSRQRAFDLALLVA